MEGAFKVGGPGLVNGRYSTCTIQDGCIIEWRPGLAYPQYMISGSLFDVSRRQPTCVTGRDGRRAGW
jgi:hypothetical protein